MRDYNFLKDIFLTKHTIDNENYLDKYLKLLLEYKLSENANCVERHHILPRCVFPEFEKEDWNIVEIEYQDHVKAHLYLFKSINIRQYQRPLNWMLNFYKNSVEISNAAKRGWQKLKNDKEKYIKWRTSRSETMKKLSSEEQQRRAKIFWDNISEEKYVLFSNKMKEYWTDDKRAKKSEDMNKYYSNPENIIKKSIETQRRWDQMDKEKRIEFSEKMNIINKDGNKRKLAGDKIKNLWQNENYLEKMKNRPHRKGKSILIIRPNGQRLLFETMKKVEEELNFSSYLIRKYIDKSISINQVDSKENELLLGCKIQSI